MSKNVIRLDHHVRQFAIADGETDNRPGRDPDSLPLLLTVPEAAKLLGISRSAAYRLAESGELPARRLGGRVYIVTAQLFAMVGAA